MKFALVDGERQESQPGLTGTCPVCQCAVIAKCGSLRLWHWAHKGRVLCDPWWEGETEWHRAWKNLFPAAWQEVAHFASGGERHIADVKTGDGWVLEFQHSPLSSEERRARTAFYPRLNWIVDGTRRKRDKAQFVRSLKEGVWLSPNAPVRKVLPDGCHLLEEWTEEKAPVFVDFGDPRTLWWFFARSRSNWVYVAPYSRMEFVACHRGEAPDAARQFSTFVDELPKLISDYERRLVAPPLASIPLPARRYRRPFRF